MVVSGILGEMCPLCDRPLGQVSVDEHHLIPKTFKGKEKIKLHKICHRKIHATFSERELLNTYNTIESLKANPDIRTFIVWVAKKDPSYYTGSDESASRKNKRRR